MSIRLFEIPVAPDGDEARRLAEEELQRQVYREAEPTFIDRVASAIVDFFRNLFNSDGPNISGSFVLLIVAIVIVGLIIAAILIWGVPRARVASRQLPRELFGSVDDRSATELRQEAERAAAAEDWHTAITARFRALARGLDERGIVDPPPGATAQAFARLAARAFVAETESLRAAAGVFDDVRYLRRPASSEGYRVIAVVDDRIARSAPAASQPLSQGAAR